MNLLHQFSYFSWKFLFAENKMEKTEDQAVQRPGNGLGHLL